MMLYKITTTAITIKMCTKLPVPIPGTKPSIPKSHTTIHITATNQRRPLILFCFKVIRILNYLKKKPEMVVIELIYIALPK